MHPLGPNLSEVPLDELVKKQGDLISRLNSAYRMGRPDIVQQLQMLLGDYQTEIGIRNQRQMDEMQKNSKNFKNIIDIQ